MAVERFKTTSFKVALLAERAGQLGIVSLLCCVLYLSSDYHRDVLVACVENQMNKTIVQEGKLGAPEHSSAVLGSHLLTFY